MAKKKAIITGITGQDGSYLAELLLEKGYEVHGVVRRSSTFNRGRIDHLISDTYRPDKDIRLHYGDLADSNSLLRILMEVQPDEFYNLAAQSHVAISFDIPEYTSDVTGIGAVRILELIRSLKLNTRFYQASSSELYGKVMETPQSETTPFYPRSPYACAKAYAYHITRNYRESYDMFAVNGILFNHESPRRGKNFVTRKITSGLADITAGKLECLYLGNLEAKRDWGYAAEFVEGMWAIMQHDTPDDYVLATGKAISVREFLEFCMKTAHINFKKEGEGMDEKYINTVTGKTIVAISKDYYRPAEVDLLIGDASKAKNELGWEAKTSLAELAEMMMKADYEKVGLSL
jgi:GDPmannose 4,6-dehydratase